MAFPVFVQDHTRESMTLYELETVKVPITDTNLAANSYTEVKTSKPYIAFNHDYYIQLHTPELHMCKQIWHSYYCEELFLVKHKSKHSCESTIYYNLSKEVIDDYCTFKYFYNTTVMPSVLDGGHEILRLDIPQDAVSFDCNIKSARGHTYIHITPWESRSHYKRWNEESYPPFDKTCQLIENFRTAERRTRAILHSRRISLNHTARVGWMCPDRRSGTPFRSPANTVYQPHYETRNGTAYRHHRRTALPPPEGMTGESEMGQENQATKPLNPQVGEDVLILGEGRAPTVSDLGPHSPDSISSSLMPYGLEEDSCPEESPEQQGPTLDQMEDEEDGNLPVEEATSKLRMGLHVGPARYQPDPPKYIRAEEEEEEDGDIEAPYLAPRDSTIAESCPEDGPHSTSSESIPDLINLNEEEPLCQQPAPTKSGKAIRPATLALNKKAAVVLTKDLLPSPLSSDKEKLEGGLTLKVTWEGPVMKKEVPEESIIYIDDDLEPSPLAKMKAQVDKLKMPPPVENTLIAAGTLLALSQGLLEYTEAGPR